MSTQSSHAPTLPFAVYAVGGAVRDRLLGLTVKDRDWVVVGATPEQLLAAGFRPVGKDFPVFLHPQSQEEYALARTERKRAPGYHGFCCHTGPEVTLEQDLARRDLTINAMAEDQYGTLIDPYGGRHDLAAGLLRHVSHAFTEDPVRVLRLARFAARFNFSVAPDTMALMRDMVSNGEMDALVAERVWQEMARALTQSYPSRFFRILRECGALARLLPEMDALFGVPQCPRSHPEIDSGEHTLRALDYAARQHRPLAVCFAVLTHDLGKALTPPALWPRHPEHEARGVEPLLALCERLRVPTKCRDLAQLAIVYHTRIHRAKELSPSNILQLFKETDALRRPDRFRQLLLACVADTKGRLHFESVPYPQATWLTALLEAARSVNVPLLIQQCQSGKDIADRIDAARLDAITVCHAALKL